MNVLSLFDGMSCGQIALNRLGIKYDNYFASEIDKYAIQIAKKNYPNTKFVGDVEQLNAKKLPKIDLLIGGSPCQSFSIAGDGSGFDGKSKLFWEYVRILKEVKPKYFLLENVKMKKQWEDIITKEMGVKPYRFNSSLVSAQNRERLYWTNIPNIGIPKDKGLVVADIMEDEVDEKYYLSKKAIDYMSRLRNDKQRWEYHKNPLDGKAACLTANMYKGVPYGVLRYPTSYRVASLEVNGHDYLKRVYSFSGKSPTLASISGGGHHAKIFDHDKETARKLTPTECERLQTVPDGYTEGVSDTQRYRMLGNGWTISIIEHIFSHIK